MPQKTKAYLALLFVCIAWGTTYLGIKLGLDYFPPFLFAGFRQVASGILMFALCFFIGGKRDFSRKNILFQSGIGFLLITMGNGLVTIGEQWVSSGVAALICSLMPLIAVGINIFSKEAEKVNAQIIIGMLIGLLGVAIIFKDNFLLLNERSFIIGIVLIFIATSSWALGSVRSKGRSSTSNPYFNAGIQVFSGGTFLMILSALRGESNNLASVPAAGWWVMVYMIVVGSLLAYTAYMFFLKVLPVGLATSYAYVNPLVAVLIGWWWRGEPLTIYTFLAFLTIVGGVYLVNTGYRKVKQAANAKPATA